MGPESPLSFPSSALKIETMLVVRITEVSAGLFLIVSFSDSSVKLSASAGIMPRLHSLPVPSCFQQHPKA